MVTKYMTALLLLMSTVTCFAADTNKSGSLIDADHYRSVVADRRAYRVGDTLTVLVQENAQAESAAATNLSDNNGVSLGVQGPGQTRNFGVKAGGTDDGTGKTTRQGQLQAELSVRVVSIEANNMLRIQGEQTIIINGESQRIVVNGLVRTEDIAPDDTIISSRLSDARIEFTGDGVITEAQKRGIFYKFFHWLGLI